jgi:long-chain-acyl-CoA dehydrogenase
VLAAIEPDVKGYFRGRKPDQVGPDASVAADLLFENVQVPSDNIIGELDYRFFHLMTHSQQERLECAISNLASAAQILDETVV